jgi:DNA ligase (NAD+)
MDPKLEERARELRALLQKASIAYYVHNAPILEDSVTTASTASCRS